LTHTPYFRKYGEEVERGLGTSRAFVVYVYFITLS